jgi:hypothetical protein
LIGCGFVFHFLSVYLVLFKPHVIAARFDLIILKPSGIVGFVGLIFSNPLAVGNHSRSIWNDVLNAQAGFPWLSACL